MPDKDHGDEFAKGVAVMANRCAGFGCSGVRGLNPPLGILAIQMAAATMAPVIGLSGLLVLHGRRRQIGTGTRRWLEER